MSVAACCVLGWQMTFWGIRAGASGEREHYALEHGVAVVGWGNVPDLQGFASRDDLKRYLQDCHPDQPTQGLATWSSQLWAFANDVSDGDLIALPRKGAQAVALGEIDGGYVYDEAAPLNARHRRPVHWLHRKIATARLDDDIRYSLRSLMTVFRVRPDGAENRIRTLLHENGFSAGSVDIAVAAPVDALVGLASHQIRERIGRIFKGERLEMLVAAILEAGGMRTLRTTGGRDGGIDIVAQGGPFGFGLPKLAVQVKSTTRPVEQHEIEAFCASARRRGSEAGLFVSWSGFRRSGNTQVMQDFFALRQWDADQLVDEVLRVYDRLDWRIRQELPLRQIWTLTDEVFRQGAGITPPHLL
jgi:restriction system protein